MSFKIKINNKKTVFFNLKLILFLGAGLFFMYQKTAVADNAGHLLISQVQVSGDKAGYDFIEIFNPTSGAINLKNYKLVKRTQSGSVDTSIKSWRNDGDIFMSPGSYFLWANSEYENYASAYISIDAVTKSGGVSDNNGVALRKNDMEEIVDSLAWGEAQNIFIEGSVFPSNPGPNQSLERKNKGNYPNALDTNNNANDFILVASHPRNSRSSCAGVEGAIPTTVATVTLSLTVTPTVTPTESDKVAQVELNKGEEIIVIPTVFPSITTYPQDVRINEFLPDPEGRDDEGEWIEVFNNSGQAINLNGWQLDDEAGKGSTPYKISETVIEPFGYIVFPYKQTKITLNNDIGEINLIAPNGQLMQKAEYVKALTGGSYNYFNDGWCWCKTPTPLAENDKCEGSGKAVDNSSNSDNSSKTTGSNKTEKLVDNKVLENKVNIDKKTTQKTVTIPPQTKKSNKKDTSSSGIIQKNNNKTFAVTTENTTIDGQMEENFPLETNEAEVAGRELKKNTIASPLRILSKNEKKPSLIPYVLLVSGLGIFFALGSLKSKEFFMRKNKTSSALDK